MSPESARRAEALGYTNVKFFHDGMPAWKKSAKLLLSEPKALKDLMDKDISHVLIDLRPADIASKGFIKGAFSVPSNELAAAKDRFPADMSAPVILYTNEGGEDAFKTVRSWGYKETTLLRGGIAAWEKTGAKLETGKLETAITYVPKPRPGEIAIEDFKSVAETRPKDKLIVDVRESDEAMHGMILGAVHIPAEKLKDRLSELPKDREIITHCVTGIRAEMAYDTLKENGFKARFLNAVIQIDKDGKYEITKK